MNADPNSKKPRSDAKLKNLPADRQADIYDRLCKPTDQGGGYANTLKWLADDGFKTSLGALSSFYSWYRLQQRLLNNARTVEQVLEDWKKEEPNITDTELEQMGQRFFSALAIEQEDSLTWKRIQDAKLKLGVLQLNRERFQVTTCELFLKWFENKLAREIAESNTPNAQKIAALRQEFFKDIDELEKSGEVELPK
jgi:hypothetical protein